MGPSQKKNLKALLSLPTADSSNVITPGMLQCVALYYSVFLFRLQHCRTRHVLQCVAVCCSVLRCIPVSSCSNCNIVKRHLLQCVAVCCSVLQCVAVCRIVLQCLPVPTPTLSHRACVAVCCSVLQCVAVCCSALQYVSVLTLATSSLQACCSVLQCVGSVLQCVPVPTPATS